MPHQEQHGTGLLGEADEVGGALAHLGHAARGRGYLLGVHHLDGIHHQHFRFHFLRRGDNGLHIGLGHQPQFVGGQLQSLGAHGHLLQGLLASDVQGVHGRRQVAHGLQQQGALAGAGIAPHQDGRSRHQAAPQHPVELLGPGRKARQVVQVDVLEHLCRGQCAGETRLVGRTARPGPAAAFSRPQPDFRERIPGAAVAALPLPLGVVRAAVVADEGGFLFGHIFP